MNSLFIKEILLCLCNQLSVEKAIKHSKLVGLSDLLLDFKIINLHIFELKTMQHYFQEDAWEEG